jgi:hypothetical protein
MLSKIIEAVIGFGFFLTIYLLIYGIRQEVQRVRGEPFTGRFN